LDFLVGATLLLVPMGIFLATTVAVQKQAIFTKDVMDMTTVAERTAKMLAAGRFAGAESGTVYITREGITFKPLDPSKAEAVGYAAATTENGATTIVTVTLYPVVKRQNRRTVKATAFYPTPTKK
jgi:hypothetical protein